MIGIHVADPWAPLLNDVEDVEEKLPGTIASIREWFRTYKIPVGINVRTYSFLPEPALGRQAGEQVRAGRTMHERGLRDEGG